MKKSIMRIMLIAAALLPISRIQAADNGYYSDVLNWAFRYSYSIQGQWIGPQSTWFDQGHDYEKSQLIGGVDNYVLNSETLYQQTGSFTNLNKTYRKKHLETDNQGGFVAHYYEQYTYNGTQQEPSSEYFETVGAKYTYSCYSSINNGATIMGSQCNVTSDMYVQHFISKTATATLHNSPGTIPISIKWGNTVMPTSCTPGPNEGMVDWFFTQQNITRGIWTRGIPIPNEPREATYFEPCMLVYP